MVAPLERASRSLSHRRTISDVPCRFPDTTVELPLSCFLASGLRRAPPCGVHLTLAPVRQERVVHPCLRGSRLVAPKRLPSSICPVGCVPLRCSHALALARVCPSLPYPFHTGHRVVPSDPRSRQRARVSVPVLAHSVPKGSLQSLRRAVRGHVVPTSCSPHSLVFKDEYPRLARYRLEKSSRSSLIR